MKFTFAAEDTIVGMICGLLLIGYTGRYFSFKLSNTLYVIAFIAYVFFLVLDIINELRDLTTHFGFIVLSLAHTLVDLLIALSFISFFSKWKIPYITSAFVPYLQGESAGIIFWIGVFLVVGNAIWLMMYPFLD